MDTNCKIWDKISKEMWLKGLITSAGSWFSALTIIIRLLETWPKQCQIRKL
jgi:hypothetical protein